MSDGPRYSNPGNSGGNDDLYRWNGDQRQLPGNNGQNQSSDRYIYDGSRQNFQNGEQDQHDAFQGDRMPGRVRPSDYPQNFTTREVTADGTVIINNVHCKNAYFNQSSIDGADYRRDPRVDFRGCDPNLSRLRENQGSTSYYDGDRSSFNGSFRIPENQHRYNSQELEMQARMDAARQRAYEQQFEQQRRMEYVREQALQRDHDEALRIQMYNESCRHANGRDRERYQPYYGNNGGCYGNERSGGYNSGGYNDGYDSRYGGPCFGNNRSGISIRIPIGHNGSFRIGL